MEHEDLASGMTLKDWLGIGLFCVALVWVFAVFGPEWASDRLQRGGDALGAIATVVAVLATVYALQQVQLQRSAIAADRENELKLAQAEVRASFTELRRLYGDWLAATGNFIGHMAIALADHQRSFSLLPVEMGWAKEPATAIAAIEGRTRLLDNAPSAQVRYELLRSLNVNVLAERTGVRPALDYQAFTEAVQPILEEVFELVRRSLNDDEQAALAAIEPAPTARR